LRSEGFDDAESTVERAEQVQQKIEQFVDVQMFGELYEITVTAEIIESEDQFEKNFQPSSDQKQLAQ